MKVNKHMHMKMRPSVYWFSSFRKQILRVWSRFNLEGRNLPWTPQNVLPSVVVSGEIEYGDEKRWTSEAKALLEGVLWKNCC